MGHQVFIWGRKGSESLAAIRKKIEAGEEGFSSITATEDLSLALAFGQLLAVSISAQQLRSLLSRSEFLGVEKPIAVSYTHLPQGEYSLVTQTASTVFVSSKQPEGSVKSYKVRAYQDVPGGRFYGEYSHAVQNAPQPTVCLLYTSLSGAATPVSPAW